MTALHPMQVERLLRELTRIHLGLGRLMHHLGVPEVTDAELNAALDELPPLTAHAALGRRNARAMAAVEQRHREREQQQQYVAAEALLTMLDALKETDDGKLPTRVILERLRQAEPDLFAAIDAKGLAELVARYGVKPTQLGAGHPGNPNGYTLTAVVAGIHKIPDPPAEPEGDPERPA